VTGASSLRDTLAAAAEAGTTIRIIYHGGHQPGAIRTIQPLKVTETEVRARDPVDGLAKTFVLARMELPGTGVPAAEYTRAEADEGNRDIVALLGEHRSALETLGWEVELQPTHIWLSHIYAYYKNGKPRRATRVQLMYYPDESDSTPEPEEEMISLVISLDGVHMERRPVNPQPAPRKRPYYLSVQGWSRARSVADGSQAVRIFLSEARRLAPGPPPPPPPPPPPSASSRREVAP
jgi:hypothetical protein